MLLTHEAPKDFPFTESGSALVDEVLYQRSPTLHFFGHYHRAYGPAEHIAGVQTRGLAINVPRGPGSSPPQGSLALLRWRGAGDWTVDAIEPWQSLQQP